MKPKVKGLRQLLYWMEERQKIYLKKLNDCPLPWTKDKILERYKFCNVYREQDRVTVWIRENWSEPYANDSNLAFAMCVARIINWPPTLKVLGYPSNWSPRSMIGILRHLKDIEQKKVYTSAYLLGQVHNAKDRAEYTANILKPLRTLGEKWYWNSLEGMTEHIATFYGWGRFLAYEVATDLRHTRYLCNASDIYTWANIGPGARRGLNRIYGREVKTGGNQAKLLPELLQVQAWITEHRDKTLLPTIESRDIEHSLCELDKYLRTKDKLAAGRSSGLEIYTPQRKPLF